MINTLDRIAENLFVSQGIALSPTDDVKVKTWNFWCHVFGA